MVEESLLSLLILFQDDCLFLVELVTWFSARFLPRSAWALHYLHNGPVLIVSEFCGLHMWVYPPKLQLRLFLCSCIVILVFRVLSFLCHLQIGLLYLEKFFMNTGLAPWPLAGLSAFESSLQWTAKTFLQGIQPSYILRWGVWWQKCWPVFIFFFFFIIDAPVFN